ncbi:MAG TPA: NUDIX hydrolase [Desulfobacterales bacterium]|nr:NUDIX hydrolase [Desulfobacterales bacterium]
MNYCSHCGAKITTVIPPGDDRPRHFCAACGTIHYENPKMVVGCIPEWRNRVLLCRRAIHPRHGKWTLPAGYLENGERVSEGAKRELFEEACARSITVVPYALYDLTFVNQMYLFFRAPLAGAEFAAGKESLEVRLFDEDQIPWGELAFQVISETLKRYFDDRRTGAFPFHTGQIRRPTF